MPATYTFDVFSTLDGYGSYRPKGDWGGYWGKQGPELLARRLALYEHEQHMVFGATTFRAMVEMIGLISGKTGTNPILADAADFDLELLESRMPDGRTQELLYRPTLH